MEKNKMDDTLDDDEDDDEVSLLIDFTQDVHMVRIIDNVFVPSFLNISAEIFPAASLDDDDFDIALTKVRFWLENIVPRCVAFSRGNETALKMMLDVEGRNMSNNLIMLTPYEPMDDHLAALFQAKMTSLSDGAIVFGSVQIKSNNMPGLTIRFIGNAEAILPSIDEWIGPRTYFDRCWWSRDDSSTLDVIPPPDTDLTQKPSWAYSLDFLEQAIRPQQDVVLHHDFRPTVIDGGKKDE